MTLADLVNLLINGTVEGLLIELPALALTLVMAIARFPNAATGDYMTVAAYAAVSIVAMALLFALLRLTPVGRHMRAVADNPDLARASGIRANRVLLVLWAVVGALCALGGILSGAKAVVSPELGWEQLIPAFA